METGREVAIPYTISRDVAEVDASIHGDTPYSGNSVTSVPVTPYTTSVDVNRKNCGRATGPVPASASAAQPGRQGRGVMDHPFALRLGEFNIAWAARNATPATIISLTGQVPAGLRG
jgi:hypothetical protein